VRYLCRRRSHHRLPPHRRRLRLALNSSYTAPAVTSDETVRVGVHRAGDWVGVSTSGANFDATKQPALRLFVDSTGDVWHVGFSTASAKSADGSLAVEIVPLRQGPQVAFDKPIVVNQQGEPEAKEPEKSFLQKSVPSIYVPVNCPANLSQVLVGNRPIPTRPGCHGWW
jgi:hypothetical protein